MNEGRIEGESETALWGYHVEVRLIHDQRKLLALLSAILDFLVVTAVPVELHS